MVDPAARRARHIAIIRLTSLGDVVHTLPVAAAIRRQRPSARITWLVEEREAALLIDNPAVDEVVTIPLRRWRGELTRVAGLGSALHELGALRRRLRGLAIDAALDVQGWPHKTSPLVLMTRAPIRVGFSWHYARHPLATWFTTVHVTPPPEAAHIVDQNLTLVAPLGIVPAGKPEFPLPAFADAQARADAWLAAHCPAGGRRVALLPATRGRAKHWPAAAYRALAARLLSDPAVYVLVLGGPAEAQLLSTVQGDLPPARVMTAAPGPIGELVGLLRRVDVAIGNDTGPIHLAAASRVPALGLFGPTRGARNGPYGPSGAFIQSPTGRMADIHVDDVLAAIARLPAKGAPAEIPS
jgi:lipopolysaccharide heptosyltransferase I